MQKKKNPKIDVKRNNSIYLSIGILLMLIFTNMTINYKSFEKNTITPDAWDLDGDDIEMAIKIPEVLPPPPPPPVKAPPVFKEMDNTDKAEETPFIADEIDSDSKIAKISEVEVKKIEDPIDEIPLKFIENPPVFPGCEKEKGNDAKKICFAEKVEKFVKKKFDTEIASKLGLEGRQKITVLFKINKSGLISSVQARAPHPELVNEAKKVIHALPKMKPGKQRGKTATVSYVLPIIFAIDY